MTKATTEKDIMNNLSIPTFYCLLGQQARKKEHLSAPGAPPYSLKYTYTSK
jgi:hypothetical protein